MRKVLDRDLTGDGKAEVVAAFLALSSVSVLPYTGARAFGTGQSYSIGASPSSISVADLNRDGKPDLVLAQRSADRVRVLWGQGGGLFDSSKVTDLTTGKGPGAVALADLNKDGAPDLVVACSGDGTASVLLSQAGGFAPAVSYPVGGDPAAVAVADA